MAPAEKVSKTENSSIKTNKQFGNGERFKEHESDFKTSDGTYLSMMLPSK